MANIVPYITFAKNGQEAITFYKGVFGGDAEVQFEGERVIHLDFQAGGIRFMGSDLQSDQAGLERGNGSSLVVDCDSEQQLRRFYSRPGDGGNGVLEASDRGCAANLGHRHYAFGVAWHHE